MTTRVPVAAVLAITLGTLISAAGPSPAAPASAAEVAAALAKAVSAIDEKVAAPAPPPTHPAPAVRPRASRPRLHLTWPERRAVVRWAEADDRVRLLWPETSVEPGGGDSHAVPGS